MSNIVSRVSHFPASSTERERCGENGRGYTVIHRATGDSPWPAVMSIEMNEV